MSSQEEILDAFVSFYAALYSPIPSYSKGDPVSLLEPLYLPTLPSEVSELLESPFGVEELAAAVGSFPNYNTPGPDGLPAEWYRQHLDIILPHLLTLYRECLKTGQLPPSLYKAHIVLIAKPDKDPPHCASYRPISLLNVDFKTLTKMLANRFMSVISHLVFEDQTGLMPDKATDINLRRVNTHLQLGPEITKVGILVFFGFRKGF